MVVAEIMFSSNEILVEIGVDRISFGFHQAFAGVILLYAVHFFSLAFLHCVRLRIKLADNIDIKRNKVKYLSLYSVFLSYFGLSKGQIPFAVNINGDYRLIGYDKRGKGFQLFCRRNRLENRCLRLGRSGKQ